MDDTIYRATTEVLIEIGLPREVCEIINSYLSYANWKRSYVAREIGPLIRREINTKINFLKNNVNNIPGADVCLYLHFKSSMEKDQKKRWMLWRFASGISNVNLGGKITPIRLAKSL